MTRLPASALLRRSLALAAVLPLSLGSLAACGGSDTPVARPSASTAVSASVPASTDSSASATSGSSVDPATFLAVFKSGYEKATTTHMTMTSSGAGSSITADGVADYSTKPLSLQLDLGGKQFGDGPAQLILVKGVMYIRLPVLGKKFITFDLDDPNNPFGTALTDQLDPSSMFDTFESALTSVTLLGSEDVNGEQMDHYELTVDSSQLLQQLGSATKIPNLPASVTYSMWFDAEGYFRQMQVDLGAAAGSLTVNYDGWGDPVAIEAPAPGQITRAPGA